MKKIILFACLSLISVQSTGAELAGIFVNDNLVTDSGQKLVLNGLGLREKFWIDVYVGSLYLAKKSRDVAEILSTPGELRVQLDFVYKEVSSEKLLDAWREGFEKNQPDETLGSLKDRMEQFYHYFETSAVSGDQYRFDYSPAQGTKVIKNGEALGVIPGEDFKNALLEIWLGNYPADKDLKRGMLGLQ